jgi:hydrogenase nickel incorporation protein HypA/HybF
MHELAVCQGILQIVGDALDRLPGPAPGVVAVTVQVGRLAAVVPDSLRSHWQILTRDTPLAGTALTIDEVPVRARCLDCAAGFELDALAFWCPVCGSGLVELLSGRELRVVSLETAEEVACGS